MASNDSRWLDFSLFGGADVLPPWLSRGGASAPSSRNRQGGATPAPGKQDRLRALSSASSSDASSSEYPTTESSASASDSEESVVAECAKANAKAAAAAVDRRAGLEWAPRELTPRPDGSDLLWMMTEEPHRSRRKAILRAHPEITKLMGHEPRTKWVVLLVTAIQFLTAFYLRDTPFFSWKFWLLAYAIGGTANQNTFLAIHEITHNLAFRGVKANRLFAIFTNLPIGVPYAMTFKKYHIEHHKYLGEDGIDTDLPSKLEFIVLRNTLGKAFFATFQIFFYAIRPGCIRHQTPTRWVFLNIATQLSFDMLVVRYLGWSAMLYFFLSSFMAGSLHPCAGHFIAEHYLFDGHDQETWSYYGPLNVLAYNVGYHNEHHDFPSIPWTRLPKLHEIAHEYYDPIPCHTSWPGVICRFILDPDVGLWCRVRRDEKKRQLQKRGQPVRGPDNGGGGLNNEGGLKDG